MSTHVHGFIPDDDPLYRKHAAVLLACAEAGIKKMPEETAQFFGESYPDPQLLKEKLSTSVPYEKISADGAVEYHVHLNQIPKGVSKIVFTNSW